MPIPCGGTPPKIPNPLFVRGKDLQRRTYILLGEPSDWLDWTRYVCVLQAIILSTRSAEHRIFVQASPSRARTPSPVPSNRCPGSSPRRRSRSLSPLHRSPRPPSTPTRHPSLDRQQEQNYNFDDSPRNSGRNTPTHDEYPPASVEKIRTALEFIRMVKEATLESQFSPEELDGLLNPMEHESTPMDDPNLMMSLRTFIGLLDSSQKNYDLMRLISRARDNEIEMLSYYRVERKAQQLSGVVTWEHDMCVKSCVGFTGPFEHLDRCPDCGAPRYDQDEPTGKKLPQKVFTTFPIGPQLQARWKNPEMAKKMHYRWEKTQDLRREHEESPDTAPGVYDDILSGQAYLDAASEAPINEYDTVLMFSVDGAQLCEHKKSDCWIYIWIILDLAPDERYKIRNILPGGVIPGPDRPKNLDSFLFPGLAHVSALQREGLPIWDAYRRRRALSFLFLFLVLADAIAMAELTGSAGHHGRKGCRLLCGFAGRNKHRGSHYYPALLRPHGFENHRTSSHPDVDVNDLPDPDPDEYRRDLHYIISSRHETELDKRRFETGIGKPSIFDGIPRILKLPTCFGGDLMHQPLINLAALDLDLWCARPDARKYDPSSHWPWAVLIGDVWKQHGAAVSAAAKHLPTSFGRVPRNPQEKASSGYKAWEFLYYIYGLGPAVFFNILPEPYYSHFCKLVRAVRIVFQRVISREQLVEMNALLLQWCTEFEILYCQRDPNRLHFVRQCVHSLTHLAKESHRLGPLTLSAQWTMERVIGYVGTLLKQPSNIFRNLSAQVKRLAYNNAIVAMWPEFEIEKKEPRGSKDFGDGYQLLRPMDTVLYYLTDAEKMALDTFCSGQPDSEDVEQQSLYRWARLKLPFDQIARSRLKEVSRCTDMSRTDRHVKVCNIGDLIPVD